MIACADETQLVSEVTETNNCAASSNTVQIVSGLDLAQTAVSDPPSTGASGSTFTITDTVQNVGTNTAPSSFTKFYLSTNGTTLNFYLNTRSVGSLTASQTDTATTTMTIPAGTSGTYRVVACADSGPSSGGRTSQIAETNETNNCMASAGTITIESPDLVITTISAPPAMANRGSSFAIMDTTSNIGVGASGAFYNKYYLATGQTPGYIKQFLAVSAAVGPLAPGASQAVSATATIPSGTTPGSYWLIGCADAGPGTSGRTSQIAESNENNNCVSSATQIIVQ